MILLASLVPMFQLALFAAGNAMTWFIDGNNLLAQKGTPRDRDVLVEKLKPIQGADDSVILVFDGRRDQSETEVNSYGTLQKVSLADGMSSDDYIRNEIAFLVDSVSKQRVQVVTADRDLRRLVLQQKKVVRGVVNPVTFWRRYLPRLAGHKKKVGGDVSKLDQ